MGGKITRTAPPRRPASNKPSVQAVRNFQVLLVRLGYLNKNHVNGALGSITVSALKAFQFENQLESTGVYNQETHQALLQALACKTPSKASMDKNLHRRSSPLTVEQLAAIMPSAKPVNLERFVGPLNVAMQEFCIDTPARQAAFLAQVAAETSDLKFASEIGAASQLGKKFQGYHGRGLLQLTWDYNYRAAGMALGLNLLKNPSQVSNNPLVAARTAAWFFSSKELNEAADKGKIGAITLTINGGYGNFDQRLATYQRALTVLKAATNAT